ncbi:MAG: N-acetylglucosamine-6-phosphate deacetylase, partial [Clostridia bacterium]|nr:N-acetylglucosamine-6-phosphate deacetylase [Clostridia bacterium]
MRKAFQNALVYVEGKGLQKTNILFGEKIEEIGGKTDGAEIIELPVDAVVLPGFIDEHIHGAGGADAMDGTEEALATIANSVAAEGTTGFLATTMTQSKENITAALQAVKRYREKSPATGAQVLGVHLEGPFIAAAHKGAQPLEYVAKPDPKVFDEYYSAAGKSIKIVTLAPEEPNGGELVKHLAKLGVVSSIGHTGAKTADIAQAIACGATNITHTYNAQSPLHHREIGTVGSALLYDELNCELIADTIHVSVPAMKLLCKCKPQGKLTLVTDAMRAKGLPDGESELGGQRVI